MSTYTSYNSYLGNKLCCKTVCEEKCKYSGITGPTGPAGAIQPTPTLQQVLTAGNTGTDKDIHLVNSVGPITNTISSAGMSSNNEMFITSTDDINLTATTSLTGKINVNATNGVVINQQGITPPDTTITTLIGGLIEIYKDESTTTGVINFLQMDTNAVIIDNTDNTFFTNQRSRVSPNEVEIYDHTSSGTNASITKISSTTFDYNPSGTKPTFYQFTYEVSNIFRYDNTGIKMGSSGTGVKLNANNIQYPATYNTSSATLGTTSNAVQTFNINVGPFTAFLPNASATNVGTQFTITNTNATNPLIVSTPGGQLIYSSTGAASATSRSLAVGHSQIFTAILTTSASTFGWSMV